MSRWIVTALMLASFGCAPSKQFADEPIVWRMEDRQPIAEPEEREFNAKRYFADVLALERVPRALAFRGRRPARNTNAVDEVPDSTWFTNRIGLFDYSAEEVARGPATGPPPQLPLTIVSGKSGGGNPGFVAKDSLGRGFVIKFDPPENPEIQTATNMVVNRLFWAAGYNVPADYVFSFRVADLSVKPGAKTKDAYDRKVPLTMEAVRDMLKPIVRSRDGSIRATASLYLSGVPKGGFPATGTRPDDANDKIPHELRRELRGLRAIAAWLGHTDMKEDNTLDMWVGEEGSRYLMHYFVDFGEALGAHQAEKLRWEDGWEHVWDWQRNTLAAVTFGFWKRPWEDTKQTPWKSIGAFAADPFEPRLWREAYPYFPFMEATPPDLYWGAKIVMRFRREHIVAAVKEGQFTDPDAARYLVDTLVTRRDKVGKEWLDAVTPLDYFVVQDGELCGVDLMVHYGLAERGAVEVLRARGKKVRKTYPVGPDGHVCVALPERGSGGYNVIRLRTRRPDGPRPVMQVHVGGSTRVRVLGVIRTEDWE